MNPSNKRMAASSFADARRYIYICFSVFALLIVSLAGYATAAVTSNVIGDIREHEMSGERDYPSVQSAKEAAAEWGNRTRYGGDFRLRGSNDRAGGNRTQFAQFASPTTINNAEASSPNSCTTDRCMKDASNHGIADLVELLKNKKVISAEEADSITMRFVKPQRGTVSESDGIAALAALLESKRIIGSDEAARFTKQYTGRNIEINENERIDKEELRKDIREQVRQQVREEMAAENKVSEKEQIQEINHDMSYLTQKVAELLYGGKVAELASPAVPEWTKRVRINGDFRLRYEKDLFDKNNYNQFTVISQGVDTQTLRNTTNNTDRFKYRVRLGVAVDVNDQLEAVVRLSTGNASTPVSTNDVMGNYMNKDNVLFDLAYLRWHPGEFLSVYGGRIPNLFYSTDLLWARDLNFEGFAVTLRKPISESVTPFMVGGAFPLQQNDFTQHNKWLAAGQLGLEKKDQRGIGGTIAAAYYYFSNITGVLNTTGVAGATNWSAPLYEQYGNTLFYIDPNNSSYIGLASKFKEIDLAGNIDVGYWDPVHIILTGDVVKNLGFDNSAVSQITGSNIPGKTVGYQIGLTVGYPVIEKFGQWNASINYKYLGGDAVVDAFTDTDFHLGGTNAKGWILGGQLGLAKNAWLQIRWLTADQIVGPPLAIDVLQLDFNARF